MRFIYLEGGSGAQDPVPPEMIRAVKQAIDVPLIVGGGIRTKEHAIAAAQAGADIIVTGNLTESSDANERISQIITAIKHQSLASFKRLSVIFRKPKIPISAYLGCELSL